MIVRLKGRKLEADPVAWIRFNSMIVRLKAKVEVLETTRDTGFNSMIVRLKDRTDIFSYDPGSAFQFYDSPIKRRRLFTRQDSTFRVSIL